MPKAQAPQAGTIIAAWDHGTTGVAQQCTPSRSGGPYPSAFLPANVPVAIPDYIGFGPVGETHAWLSGVSEARATIDLVRATRRLPNVRSNGTWFVAGHSQEGHAALFSAEQAASYAPELDLQGVIAIAPGTELNEPSYVTSHMKPAAVMVLAGLALDYPRIDPETYLTPAAEAKWGVLETGCLNEIIAAYLTGDLVDVGPFDDQFFVDLLVENEPGHAPADVPVLVLQGGQDFIVPPGFTEQYVQRACDLGDLVDVGHADHGTILGQSATEARQWLATVAAGQTPPTNC